MQSRVRALDLSIVIPVKDEAGNIRTLTGEIHAALEGLVEYEIIYVDDGSGDATAAEIRQVQGGMPQIRLLRHAKNWGQSAAIRTGVRAARGDWIATLDGDGQNDPADLPGLWRFARRAPPDPPLLITGHRKQRRDDWRKRWASRFANAIRRWCLGDDTPDTGCGLKLFPRSLFLDLPFFNHMHRFLPALVLREGGIVRSLPINHRPRFAGRSKYGILDRALGGIIDLFGLMWLQRRTARPHILSEALPAADATASPEAPAPAASLPR
jgi:dolichol-phosphate mannosyltransferase